MLLLCAVQRAVGQCGSAHDTDLDGSFVSSTSSDPCSGGGISLLQARIGAPSHRPVTARDAFRFGGYFPDPILIFPEKEYSVGVGGDFTRVDQLKSLRQPGGLLAWWSEAPRVVPDEITVLVVAFTVFCIGSDRKAAEAPEQLPQHPLTRDVWAPSKGTLSDGARKGNWA